ncbi:MULTISPECIES: hypothetical protein [Parabacteroides]|uniref:hypothetical protein n=1 Tax=Parabacteroides leei TaxID=2939491 RepID=UPI00189874BD|nr:MULTISPECIES: hypothetical protein [Parabacteroides]MCL3854445.1 hypothetical protein [Parabacteroides leei]
MKWKTDFYLIGVRNSTIASCLLEQMFPTLSQKRSSYLSGVTTGASPVKYAEAL